MAGESSLPFMEGRDGTTNAVPVVFNGRAKWLARQQMKIFGFGKSFSLTQHVRKVDVFGALLCGAIIGFRMMFAEEDFSYDYSAYIYYFDLLGDYSFLEVLQHAGELFPYVLLPRHRSSNSVSS